MNRGEKSVLRAAIEDGEVVLRVGVDTLCYALRQDAGIRLGIVITDEAAFAKWFADNLIGFDTDEAGVSAIERVFDRLADDAAESALPFCEPHTEGGE